MDKKINVLCIPSNDTGVGYYRSIWPHMCLDRDFGDRFHVDIVKNLPNEKLDEFFAKYDVVHIHKSLDNEGKVAQLIKFMGAKLVVDIDDHYKLGEDHPMALTAKLEKWHEPPIKHLELADAVTTTTSIFADVLKKHNKNVFVIPNGVDSSDDQYSPVKNDNPGGRLRVGIICGSSHLKDLELISNVAQLVNKDKVQLVLCGFDTNGTRTIINRDTGEKTVRDILPEESIWCEFEKIVTDNYRIVTPEHKEFLLKYLKNADDPFKDDAYMRCWTKNIREYATHYRNVDVLLAPLKENEFNKVKSELKVIECGFTRTAFIGQNFGPYTVDGIVPMIEKGGKINENGNVLLVESSKNHKQWAKYINKLADDRGMVKRLQDNLHDFVVGRYELKDVTAKRAELYEKLVKGEI